MEKHLALQSMFQHAPKSTVVASDLVIHSVLRYRLSSFRLSDMPLSLSLLPFYTISAYRLELLHASRWHEMVSRSGSGGFDCRDPRDGCGMRRAMCVRL